MSAQQVNEAMYAIQDAMLAVVRAGIPLEEAIAEAERAYEWWQSEVEAGA